MKKISFYRNYLFFGIFIMLFVTACNKQSDIVEITPDIKEPVSEFVNVANETKLQELLNHFSLNELSNRKKLGLEGVNLEKVLKGIDKKGNIYYTLLIPQSNPLQLENLLFATLTFYTTPVV